MQELVADFQRGCDDEAGALLGDHPPQDLAESFDDLLLKDWAPAQVGFAVTLSGTILCPRPQGPEAQTFLTCNSRFLANRESAEVYWTPKSAPLNVTNDLREQSAGASLKRNEPAGNSSSFDFKNSLAS